ncbi:MAG TPA: BREX system ATP-binding domain-containing protein [Candidatus Entotheonella sp.]|jgi:hypothetical protein
MSKLATLLSQPSETRMPSLEGSFFESYGVLRNPFPPNRTIIPEVLYDQAIAWQKFENLFREMVLSDHPERRAMGIIGGTGGGKTHFLRHCQWEVEDFCHQSGRRFVIAEFQAGSGKVQDIVRNTLWAADAFCRSGHERGAVSESDFATAIVRALEKNDKKLDDIQQEDLRSALRQLKRSTESDYQPDGRGGQYDFETLRDLFRRWLDGNTLTQTERKYLGVSSRVSTASMAARLLREVFTLARSLDIIEGIVLCLDEVETLFTSGQRPAKYQAFLQDLRYLYDESLRNNSGYSLLMLSASTALGAENLRDVNYPVYQRLGFEGGARAELAPISGVVDARDFAYEYIEFAHDQWEDKRSSQPSSRNPKELLSEKEIEEAYRSALAATDTTLRREGQVYQASLLDALYRKVEAKVTSESV